MSFCQLSALVLTGAGTDELRNIMRKFVIFLLAMLIVQGVVYAEQSTTDTNWVDVDSVLVLNPVPGETFYFFSTAQIRQKSISSFGSVRLFRSASADQTNYQYIRPHHADNYPKLCVKFAL